MAEIDLNAIQEGDEAYRGSARAIKAPAQPRHIHQAAEEQMVSEGKSAECLNPSTLKGTDTPGCAKIVEW